MTDPITTVRSHTPEADPSDALLARVRSDLMSTITPTQRVHSPVPTRRSKRRWLLPAAAAAVVLTGAGAWAVKRDEGPTNLGISCPGSRDGSIVGVQATSGDPVADCAATWVDLHGGEAPPMTAYVSPAGEVAVVLAGQPAPDGFVAMPNARFDAKLIELQESLADIAGDLPHGCTGEAGARSVVQHELDRLDLEGWTVRTDPARPIDETRPCARADVHGRERRVVLRGDPRARAFPDAYQRFAQELDEQLQASCSTLPEAEAVTKRVAAATDVSALTDVAFTTEDGLLHIDSVEDPTAPCTRASVSVGGRVQVTLRGPAS